MNKTENVSIGRKPFVCDHDAYDLLMGYLERAKKALKKDPDAEEVLADLELSMATHLEELSSGLVVDKHVAEKVISIMGEVDPGDDAKDDDYEKQEAELQGEWERVKKIFKRPITKDRSRQVVDGVCAGIARSIDIDPFWIRVVFVFLTFITDGFMILVYLIICVVMKEDSTHAKGRKASEVMNDVRAKIDDSNILVRIERVLRKIVVVSFRVIKLALQIITALVLLVLICVWLTAIFKLGSDSEYIPLLISDRGWLEYVFVGGLGLLLIIPLVQLYMSSKTTRTRNIAWSVWTLAIVATVASGINLYPRIHDYIVTEKPSNQFMSATVINGRIEDFCLGYCQPEFVVRVTAEDCEAHANGVQAEVFTARSVPVSYVADTEREKIQTSWYGWTFASKKFDLPLSIGTYCSYIDSVQKSVAGNVVFVGTLPTSGFGIFDAVVGQKTGEFELIYYVRDPDPVKWYDAGPSGSL